MNRVNLLLPDIGNGANLELVDMFCYLGDMLCVGGNADAAVEARVHKGWNKFRQLVPLLVSLLTRGKLYTSCVHSCMLHSSETRPVKKENELTLQQAEMRTIWWTCGIKIADRFSSSELRERLGIDNILQ